MKKKIMIIDDDPTCNYISEFILSALYNNADIKSYVNPIEALAHLEASDDSNNCLILLDLNMPIMNGYQFLEKIRQNDCRCNVIILTSSKNLLEKEYSQKFEQVKAFISKPFCTESAHTIAEFF